VTVAGNHSVMYRAEVTSGLLPRRHEEGCWLAAGRPLQIEGDAVWGWVGHGDTPGVTLKIRGSRFALACAGTVSKAGVVPPSPRGFPNPRPVPTIQIPHSQDDFVLYRRLAARESPATRWEGITSLLLLQCGGTVLPPRQERSSGSNKCYTHYFIRVSCDIRPFPV
jgi:hypothetical protein